MRHLPQRMHARIGAARAIDHGRRTVDDGDGAFQQVLHGRAASLGLPLVAMRAALVGVLALSTGAAVAQTGLIAFVGLASPHLVRSIVKTTHGKLVVLSALMGGALLMAADVLARWVIAPQELPVGVLTAVLGGSYLLWLMHRRSVRGSGVL